MIPQETMNSDEIYEDLCNKIEKLVYLPGDKISENESIAKRSRLALSKQ